MLGFAIGDSPMETKKNLRIMAVELNNYAVQLHSDNQLEDACALYKDALKAMRDSFRMIEANDRILGGHATLHTPENEQEKRHAQQFVDGNRLQTETGHSSPGADVSNHYSASDRNTERFARPSPISMHGDYFSGEGESFAAILLHNMGLLNCQRGLVEQAVNLLKMASSLIRCVKAKKKNVHLQAWVSIHFILGVICSRRKKHEQALQWFLVSARIRLDRNHGRNTVCANLMNRIGHILYSKGQIQEAIEAFHGASLIYSYQPKSARDAEIEMIVDDAAAPAA